jgi:UDP:flavonoid glycosyltransferase YjiC (YdhE family)
VKILLCPLSDPGYLYPVLAVGRRLRQLGDQVTVLGRAGAESVVTQAGLDFCAAAPHTGGSGFTVGRWFLDVDRQYLQVLQVAREIKPDVLLTSVLSLGSLLAAEILNLPIVVLGLGTHVWNYANRANADPKQIRRQWRSEQMLQHYQVARDRVGLPPRHDRYPERPLHGAMLLLRGDRCLEPPAAEMPPATRHIGECSWEPAFQPSELSSIAEQLDRIGKPTVYVHLGRTFGGRSMWPRLNAAFTDGPLQAVVEQGRSGAPEPALEADLTVVRKPWLGPLIERSVLVLTSGTSAPTLAALAAGRPLVMAPAGSEQPMLTAACVRAGVALRLPESGDPATLKRVLDTARYDGALADASAALGTRLRTADGVTSAADYVHAAVRSDLAEADLAG